MGEGNSGWVGSLRFGLMVWIAELLETMGIGIVLFERQQ
jgi:hypothetical protein